MKSTLKQGQSAGPDDIPPEVPKNCNLDNIILEIYNCGLIENIKPDIWSLSNIIPVPKSGGLAKPDNYRGISLTCVIAKMIRDAIDPHLRDDQNGFRKGTTAIGQILVLGRIIEEVKNNLTAMLCFIDFKKAFDSLDRSIMLKILKAYGVPPNLLRAIKAMYKGTRAKVTPDGISEEFDILAGVQQGDTLDPFLFVVALALDPRLKPSTGGSRSLVSELHQGSLVEALLLPWQT